jgi:hypothetical protein
MSADKAFEELSWFEGTGLKTSRPRDAEQQIREALHAPEATHRESTLRIDGPQRPAGAPGASPLDMAR